MYVKRLNDWLNLLVRLSHSLHEHCGKWGQNTSSCKLDEYRLCPWFWWSQIADVCSILIHIKLQRHKMYSLTWTVNAWLRMTHVLNDSAWHRVNKGLKCDQLSFLGYRGYMFDCKYSDRVHLPSAWLTLVCEHIWLWLLSSRSLCQIIYRCEVGFNFL